MDNPLAKYKCHFFYVFAAFLEFIVLFPISPSFREVPLRDSGVFLYAAQQILHGGLPYISVWDHKGPIIYYINTIGQLISSQSWWGVWVIEFLFIYVSVIIGFVLLKQLFGFFPAILGSISWLTLLFFIIEGGNLTEEYGILFQFIIIFLFFLSEQEGGYSRRDYFLIGITTCLIFLLKPNLTGLSLAIFFYLLITIIVFWDNNLGLTKMKYMVLGFFMVLITVCIIFFLQGTFFDFIDQYFVYNFFYASSDLSSKTGALRHLVSTLAALNIIVILLISWVYAIIFVYSVKTADIRNKILIITILDLPFEMLLISIPGKNYAHYYMSLVPSITILIGFFIWILTSNYYAKKMTRLEIPPYFGKILAVLIIFGFCFTPTIYLQILNKSSGIDNFLMVGHIFWNEKTVHQPIFPSGSEDNSSAHAAIGFIENNTKTKDTVLIVGAESAINYITERKAPTRYVYQYPLFTKGYDNDKKDSEFLADISKNAPKLIIVTENSDVHFEKFNSILKDYQLVTTIGESKWKIYQKIE